MFKHILIPTDGSEAAAKAAEAAIELAREMHAKVTGFVAVEGFHTPGSAEMSRRTVVLSDEYEKQAKLKAEGILASLASRAQAAGVEFDVDYAQSDHPYEAIIDAAQKHDCDLIVIASHGHRGLSRLLHGNTAQRVLTHSTIPTLVYH